MRYSAWIIENYPAAQAATAGTGIFPEVLLSQAIIESSKKGAMPGSDLAKIHNNFFGIKAGKSWKGKKTNYNTGEFTPGGEYYKERADFRAYNSPAESFADYVKLLQGKRYAAARKAITADRQAIEIKKAGYSTAPDYAEKVAALANTIKSASAELLSKAAGAAGKNKGKLLLLLAAAAAAAIALKNK
jgi:flagellar protein FlgJ